MIRRQPQRVLVVGSRGNIGSAIAAQLTRDGLEVVGMTGYDVTQQNEVDRFFRENPAELDHVVYSVSAPIVFKDLKNETADALMRHFEVQAKGLFLLSQTLVANHPLKSITVIGSSCLFGQPPARLTSYITAKYALLGLMRSLSHELAPKGIRVNMISPGLTGDGISKTYPRPFIEITLSQTPLKRLVTGKDVAGLTSFLISDQASYITGINIPLDGGLHHI